METKRHSNYETSTKIINMSEADKLRAQLEQQTLQNQQTLEQLVMIRNQLISETNTRIEAQVFLILDFIYIEASVENLFFFLIFPNSSSFIFGRFWFLFHLLRIISFNFPIDVSTVMKL